MRQEHIYRGRFAPSPTGRLHLGSLACALATWVDARAHAGEWFVRIEDIDPQRDVPGVDKDILRTLEAYGLRSDGPVLWQSERGELYRSAFERLESLGRIYPCSCTRKTIEEWDAAHGKSKGYYPGTCRSKTSPSSNHPAWRFLLHPGVVRFRDRRCGLYEQDVLGDVGDFILKRSDGHWAYQLAVVVDDAAQGITDVVRGEDLLDNTPRQIALIEALGYSIPRYLHIPLVRGADGEKLSKQTLAKPVETDDVLATYEAVWRHFGFERIGATTLEAFLRVAVEQWKEQRENAL